MAILSAKSFSFISLTLCFLSNFLPSISSFSSVSISETSGQTLICALTHSSGEQQSHLINCNSFPQGIQIPRSPSFGSFSGIAGGNGFLCASSSSGFSSIMVCWRFSANGSNMSYKRIYQGPVLEDLDSGNSHLCGLVNGSGDRLIQCWQWQQFNSIKNNSIITSGISVGEEFVCGLSELGQVQCLGTYSAVTDYAPPGGDYIAVAAGFRHACAISVNGSLECWGNMVGEKPEGLHQFTSLALGENRSCGLIRPNGTVICWGGNNFSVPQFLKDTYFVAIEANRDIFCGVTTSNFSLYCWGNEILDSNPVIFDNVVPGPCRSECPCAPLPNSNAYCDEGFMICAPCALVPSTRTPPAVAASPPPPPPTPPQSPLPSTSSGGRRWSKKLVIFLVVGCVGSLSLVAVSCFLFFRYCKVFRGCRIHDSGRLDDETATTTTHQQPEEPRPQVLEKRLSHLISLGGNGSRLEEFSLQELTEATNNFSEDQKIGNGSFGSVYHGTLKDGVEVAIKRAEASTSSSYAAATKKGQEDKDNAFLNELEFLSRLNHKNLVRLLGYCEDSNERVLVYEYMRNGTLHDHIHHHKHESSPLRAWPARIKAALDAARGIEYLHEYAVPPVIHRDIKSSNILLDNNWTAKVSDFGLSLMGPEDEDSHLSLTAAGTVGYMDPEYYRLQQLTTKSDVYSFGVVLLEVLSGCKAIHRNENGVPRNVVDFVVPYVIQDEIHRVLDPKVPAPTPFEIEAVAYVGYLAVDCVTLEGRDRPSMTEIVNSLERAWTACVQPPEFSRSTTHSST